MRSLLLALTAVTGLALAPEFAQAAGWDHHGHSHAAQYSNPHAGHYHSSPNYGGQNWNSWNSGYSQQSSWGHSAPHGGHVYRPQTNYYGHAHAPQTYPNRNGFYYGDQNFSIGISF